MQRKKKWCCLYLLVILSLLTILSTGCHTTLLDGAGSSGTSNVSEKETVAEHKTDADKEDESDKNTEVFNKNDVENQSESEYKNESGDKEDTGKTSDASLENQDKKDAKNSDTKDREDALNHQTKSGNKTETHKSNTEPSKTENKKKTTKADKPDPVEPEEESINKQNSMVCTLKVDCSILLSQMDQLADGKEVCVPEDGAIFATKEVTFYEGESVYDILVREMKAAKIQMEASFTPAYDSAYVEGINNLYEFDGGSLSGWMYCVNGWYPNYGCSRYEVKEGDIIEWNYTCDLGRDLGANWEE